jgi:hypothetical protein
MSDLSKEGPLRACIGEQAVSDGKTNSKALPKYVEDTLVARIVFGQNGVIEHQLCSSMCPGLPLCVRYHQSTVALVLQ